MSVLLIGIGNPLRGDDGAGIEAAQRISDSWHQAGRPHRLQLVHQLLPELAEDIAHPEVQAVLFVDASLAPSHPHQGPAPLIDPAHAQSLPFTGNTLGELPAYQLFPLNAPPHTPAPHGSMPLANARPVTHHLSPTGVLAYVDGLYTHTPDAWILALPASHFGFGAEFSATTRQAIDQAAVDAGNLWAQITQGSPSSISIAPH